MVIEDAQISSSEVDPPYYTIRASKLWITSPGDWGLENATVYVGNVPLFYFPFFFNPGDELIFRPSFGFNDRDGFFLHTTTYLLGKGEEANPGISFLQLAQQSGGRTVPRGLFLHRTGAAEETTTSDYVRLLGDIYTRLGGYLGIEGSFAQLAIFDRFEFSAGFSLTQHIYALSGNQFSNLYDDGEQYNSSLVQSNFLGLELPLRYLFDLSFRLSAEALSLDFDFVLHSDPTIAGDFPGRTRLTSINWLDLIEQRQTTSTSASATRSSLDWRAVMRYSPSIPEIRPFVEQVTVDELSAQLRWVNRAIPSNRLRDEARRANNSPEQRFFFPRAFYTS